MAKQTIVPMAPNMSSGSSTGFHAGVAPDTFAIHIGDSMALQAQKLAEQDGRIQGLQTAISAVQGSLGFWQTAGIGFAAIVLTVMGIVLTLELGNRSDLAGVDRHVGELSSKVDEVGRKVDGLPVAISAEVRSMSKDMNDFADSKRDRQHRQRHSD